MLVRSKLGVSAQRARSVAALRPLLRVLALTTCVMGVAPDAYADGMRCGSKLVSDGDSLYTVKSRCGEPNMATRRMEVRTIRRWVAGPCAPNAGATECGRFVEHSVEVQVDEWVYDFGPHNFVRYLTFEQGTLLRVVTGSYGTLQE